jgi:hypothetical protein
MSNIIRSFFHPLRITIPDVIDVIMVSDPEHIKHIEAAGDVDRLHRYDTAALPWWVKLYFRATRFHDPERDLWFLPFESAADPSYQPRRLYLERMVSSGYTQNDVERIARLLETNAGEDDLAYEMVQVVNRRFFGEEIPRFITEEAARPLRSFGEAVFPWRYVAATKAQQRVLAHCAQRLPKGVNVLDVAHNIGVVVQAAAGALRILQANVEKPVEEILTSHAPTPQVPRIAVRSSTFGGLLRFPTRAGQTVIIYKIGKAAAKTKDLFFTFGAGRPERACVFMDFFLAFARDVQKVLREAQSERPPDLPNGRGRV